MYAIFFWHVIVQKSNKKYRLFIFFSLTSIECLKGPSLQWNSKAPFGIALASFKTVCEAAFLVKQLS
jgi:hypothetical protein